MNSRRRLIILIISALNANDVRGALNGTVLVRLGPLQISLRRKKW